jgi:hypothetical protein
MWRVTQAEFEQAIKQRAEGSDKKEGQTEADSFQPPLQATLVWRCCYAMRRASSSVSTFAL